MKLPLYFKRALAKNPSPYAYEGLARSFSDRDRFFDAMFTLKEASKQFPQNTEILTNLAYLYNRKTTRFQFDLFRKSSEFSNNSLLLLVIW
jgi:tetratricopeptide (TPR) repeat protein